MTDSGKERSKKKANRLVQGASEDRGRQAMEQDDVAMASRSDDEEHGRARRERRSYSKSQKSAKPRQKRYEQ